MILNLALPAPPITDTMSSPSNLSVAPSASQPLTPEQVKFNRLVARIEKARAELLAWQDETADFAQAHVQRVRPLLVEIEACHRALVDKLDALLAGTGWTKTERRTMRNMLCEEAAGLIESESTDDAQRDHLKAIHDRHAETDFDTENRESMALFKEMFEAVAGVDLGDEAFESEDEMMQRAQERLAAQHEARQTQDQPRRGRPKKPTAAQRKRDDEAREASQSVREVYRQLASALHPDRAVDDADRATRTAQMQRVNQAYDANDLLALFALQLEIEQIDAARLAHATAQRARHYNRVLTAQLAELQAEIEGRQAAFRFQFGLDPFERVQPAKLGVLLNREVAELRAALAEANRDLRRLDDPVAAKRWFKQVRREARMFDDELPF